MKTFNALSLFVVVVSAGILPPVKQQHALVPLMPLEELEGRITNGQVAKPGQFPYQAGLSLVFGKKRAWCGGTIIKSSWILTVAHCTDGADGVTVYLGATDIKKENEEGQQRINVSNSNIFVHPGWNPIFVRNDISLIKLPAAIEFNDLIQPATLPKKNDNYSSYEDNLVWASGWGKPSDSVKTMSQFLRYIEVPVLKNSICTIYYLGRVSNDMICTKTTGKKSTCQGDSGGPLVYKKDGVNYLIGATSFGIIFGCEKGWPAVFTRVTSYLDWIEDVSGVVNN